MTDSIISINDIGKRYRIAASRDGHRQFRQTLGSLLQNIFQNKNSGYENFWALKNINLEIKPGEAVGIIGHNGAGKSTLLKILSRITRPTTGEIRLRGRVASLLEVGTGFHPELTGRENIYLNGAILGMTRSEINKKFDEIVDFCEIGRFLDTPVKRYSSGMYVRLAFGVAAHLEPEILLIDEVLAVGDAQFQKKCLGKMEAVAYGGRTIFFVSHNMTAVESLCSRVIHLDRGNIVGDGEPKEIIGQYLNKQRNNRAEKSWDENNMPGCEEIRLTRIAAIREDNSDSDINIHTPLQLEIDYHVYKPEIPLTISILLYNEMNVPVFNSIDMDNIDRKLVPGHYRSSCHIPGNLLNDGNYRVFICFLRNQMEALFYDESILNFIVEDDVESRMAYHGKIPGVVRPKLNWSTTSL